MRIILCFLLVFSFCFSLKAQHPIGDKLEQLYYQGHYSIVYRKSAKYINKEETKNLLAPKYYFAISSLQKSNNIFWLKRNKDKVDQSFEILEKFKNDDKGKQFLLAHSYELYELEIDLHNWLTDLKQSKLKDEVSYYSSLVNKFYVRFDFSELQVAESTNLEWKGDRATEVLKEVIR
ncbi:MAG: hypothetical protein ACKO7D_08920 [Bacteroidota bacterium]